MAAGARALPCGAGLTAQLADSGLPAYLGAAEEVPEGGGVRRARDGRRSYSMCRSSCCECLWADLTRRSYSGSWSL